jgi:hypothetical protein
MRRVVPWIGPVLVLVLLLAGTANAQGWTAVSPEGGRCKVDMPGTPTVETVPLNSPGQTLTMTEAKVQAGGTTFFMSWVDYPERIALSASSDTMLDKVRDGMAAGSTLRGEKKLTLGRAQGREFTLGTGQRQHHGGPPLLGAQSAVPARGDRPRRHREPARDAALLRILRARQIIGPGMLIRRQPHPEERPQGASRRVGHTIVVAHPSRRRALRGSSG